MKIKVARTLDDFMKVMSVRSVVFIGEQHHDYVMEFDENELSGRTHLLAVDDAGNPTGCMRIWKEGKEAKFERLTVMPEHRGSELALDLIKFGMAYCHAQRVETVCLYCEPKLQEYWQKKEFERVGGNKVLKYRGLDLVPVVKKIGENGGALTEKERAEIPQIMLLQEGEWYEAAGDSEVRNRDDDPTKPITPAASVALIYYKNKKQY